MIKKVSLKYFKQFKDTEFTLSDRIVLAGPNNSGKTTLLQAIAAWHLGLRKWVEIRGESPKPKERTAVPITRKDFTAIPLKEMKYLWTDTSVAFRKEDIKHQHKPGYPKAIEITLEGNADSNPWVITLEFRYQSTEQIYVKVKNEHLENISLVYDKISINHVPPFSGIGTEEPFYKKEYQDVLIGQGKPGDILRNLLLEIYLKEGRKEWEELCKDIRELFGYTLEPLEYEGKPFIDCAYLRGLSLSSEKVELPSLDIATAGSGFHQVLLLLAFFYARPSSVLLLDEPDAHLHAILQDQIYKRLLDTAFKRNCQLIIATHSEVIIDKTSSSELMSFFRKPHRLNINDERDQIREALKRLTASDILMADTYSGILYLESDTDFKLLSAWAKVLQHPILSWFEQQPFWNDIKGRDPRLAKGHFYALKAINNGIRGFLLLDGDNRNLPEHEVTAEGLVVRRWQRYESENYLLHPESLIRFIRSQALELSANAAEKYLKSAMLPLAYQNPLGEDDEITDFFSRTPASKTILPRFLRTGEVNLTKSEYFLIAEQMKPPEIAGDVKNMLDEIQKAIIKTNKLP